MKGLPRSTAGRMALAAVVALAAIAALELLLRGRDAAVLAARRDPAPWRPDGDREAPDVAPDAADPRAPSARGLRADRVVLCADPATARDAAACYQLLADGSVAVRRPPPLPAVPGRQRLAAVAVALPAGSLTALSPQQRAGLLDLLGTLVAERPVPPDRVVLAGLGGARADLTALLGWVR
ncbi:MAG: hypothetical protein AB7O97_01325 [Planctomycetota bacterium]